LGGAMSIPSAMAAAEAAKDQPARRECFYARDVSNFAPVNDRLVNVRVGVNKIYQFELFAPCPDINWRETLALRATGGTAGWICSGLDAEVFVPSSIGPRRCPVGHIRRLSPEEVAALPKKEVP
jgi:hypothetical protein